MTVSLNLSLHYFKIFEEINFHTHTIILKMFLLKKTSNLDIVKRNFKTFRTTSESFF